MQIKKLLAEQADNRITLPIYRGVGSMDPGSKEPVQIQIRKDRRPTDSMPTFSALFNLGIEKKLGIPEVRKSSAFASTSREVGEQYATQGMEYGRANYGTLMMLEVEPTAVVVFNTEVMDSLDLEEELPLDWYSFAKEWAEKKNTSLVNRSRAMINLYMQNNATGFWQALAQHLEMPDDVQQEFMKILVADAMQLVNGYQKLDAYSFAMTYLDTQQSFECMVTGVDSFYAVPEQQYSNYDDEDDY